jgi:hypothetical protein
MIEYPWDSQHVQTPGDCPTCGALPGHQRVLAARASGGLAERVRALADEWDAWLPVYWTDGRRVVDDIDVRDLTAQLRALLGEDPA